MDPIIIFALVICVLSLGLIFWLVIYARNRSQKHTMRTSIKPHGTRSDDGA